MPSHRAPGSDALPRLWHESQTGRSTRPFAIQDANPEVAQLLQTVAALRAIPPVTARAEFVNDLRERLMAQTTERHQLAFSRDDR